MMQISRETYEALTFDLDVEVAAFNAAKAAHALTVGVPAPVAHPLVEQVHSAGGYIVVDEPAEPELPLLAIPSLIAQKRRQIHDEARRQRDQLAPHYPQHEIDTWDQQRREAVAYQADPSIADTPLLTAMATARGMTVEALAARVLVKAQAFAQAGGAILGAQQALEDQLGTILADLAAGTITEAEARTALNEIDPSGLAPNPGP